MKPIKRTTVSPEESVEQKNRPGFQSVCCYGDMQPEKNEIGGIFKTAKNFRIERGMGVFDAECAERIFIESPK